MKIGVAFLCFLTCFNQITQITSRSYFKNDLQLQLVQVLFRHGERTPTEREIQFLNYTDPSMYQPTGLGQLTKKGKNQVYNIGTMLRKRYDSFLDRTYNPNDIYAYSSEHDRTKTSLELVLFGLYCPKWRPVPFRYTPKQLDIILKSYDSSKFVELHQQVFHSREYEERISNFSDFFSFIKEKTGVTVRKDQTSDIFSLFNNLYFNDKMNLPLPDWYDSEVRKTLLELIELGFDTFSFTPELIRINGGNLVKTFLKNMNINNSDVNPRRIYVYSGHDLNVAAYLRAHGVQIMRYPDFASAVILEKWKNDKDHFFVRMLGWNGIDRNLTTIKLCGTQNLCPMDEYLKLIRYAIPSDEEMNYLLNDFNVSEIPNVFFNDPLVEPRNN